MRTTLALLAATATFAAATPLSITAYSNSADCTGASKQYSVPQDGTCVNFSPDVTSFKYADPNPGSNQVLGLMGYFKGSGCSQTPYSGAYYGGNGASGCIDVKKVEAANGITKLGSINARG